MKVDWRYVLWVVLAALFTFTNYVYSRHPAATPPIRRLAWVGLLLWATALLGLVGYKLFVWIFA